MSCPAMLLPASHKTTDTFPKRLPIRTRHLLHIYKIWQFLGNGKTLRHEVLNVCNKPHVDFNGDQIYLLAVNRRNMNWGCCKKFGTFDDIIMLWDTWTLLNDIENFAKHTRETGVYFVDCFVSRLCCLASIWCILLLLFNNACTLLGVDFTSF